MIAIWIMSCTGQVAECVGSCGWCGSSSSSVGLHQCSWRGFPQPLLPVVHRPAARGLICHVFNVVCLLHFAISKNCLKIVDKSKIFCRQIQNISSTNPKYFVDKSQKIVDKSKTLCLQSGRSSLAKHEGAYFSVVYGFMKDPIAAPGPYENQEC